MWLATACAEGVILFHTQSDEDEFAKLKEAAAPSPKKQRSDSIGSDDFQEFESYQENQDTSFPPANPAETEAARSDSITHSSTNESLVDAQAAKSFTPSMSSSGYGSQAVSTQTLSSEDSTSVRSISIDDTPENSMKTTNASRPNTLEKTDSGENNHNNDKTHHAKVDVQSDKTQVIVDAKVEVQKDKTQVIDTKTESSNTKPAETKDKTEPKNGVLKRSSSLIDDETDVPSNLEAPLQPQTPAEEDKEQGKTAKDAKPEEEAKPSTVKVEAKEEEPKEAEKAKVSAGSYYAGLLQVVDHIVVALHSLHVRK